MSDQIKRKVAIAVDDSEHSKYALEWYLENLTREGDEVLVINTRPFNVVPAGSVTIGAASGIWEQLEQEVTSASERILRHFGHELTQRDVKHRLLMVKGEARDCIVDTVKEEQADMLVIGCRGLGAMKRTFLGSVSDYCVHHVHVPVVVVRK